MPLFCRKKPDQIKELAKLNKFKEDKLTPTENPTINQTNPSSSIEILKTAIVIFILIIILVSITIIFLKQKNHHLFNFILFFLLGKIKNHWLIRSLFTVFFILRLIVLSVFV